MPIWQDEKEIRHKNLFTLWVSSGNDTCKPFLNYNVIYDNIIGSSYVLCFCKIKNFSKTLSEACTA